MGPETPSQLGASPNGAPSAIAGPVAASSSANTAAAAPATTMTVPTPTMATAPSAPLQQQQQQQQAQAQQRPGPMEPNVLNVVLGDLLVKPWYPSFYPEELVGRRVERLYVCQWCFKYSKELIPFLGHTVSVGRRACAHAAKRLGLTFCALESMQPEGRSASGHENLRQGQLLDSRGRR